MLKLIDNFLDWITMYRLVLYFLGILAILSVIFSVFHLLPFNPLYLLLSFLIFLIFCFVFNKIFSTLFKAWTNIESVYITALILSFLIIPATSFTDTKFILIAAVASLAAMAGKYILAFRRAHIFNPAALGVLISGLLVGGYGSWWIGVPIMLPFVIIGGLLAVRKIRRFQMVTTFIIVASIAVLSYHFSPQTFLPNLKNLFLHGPLFFFAFVMLTEPMTTPPTHHLRLLYAAFIGALFYPGIHIASLYFSPELALVTGNLLSFIVSPREKLILHLEKKIQAAKDTYSFFFKPSHSFSYKPGQYLEWTLPHEKADSRGNRRYFTIASSPTEKDLIIGVKFNPNSSTFKQILGSLKENDKLIAANRAGDFVLPKDEKEKMVFIAGGIGITPFRSMLKYLIDRKEKRDIVLLYSNRTEADIAFRDIIDQAVKELNLMAVFTLTDEPSPSWQGKRGFIDENMIKNEVPDYLARTFYLSGPQGMVNAFSDSLGKMGVKSSRIRKDYFPGFV